MYHAPNIYQAGFLVGRAARGPFKRSVCSNPCPLWSDAWHTWREGFKEGSKKALTSAGYGRTRQRNKGVSHVVRQS